MIRALMLLAALTACGAPVQSPARARATGCTIWCSASGKLQSTHGDCPKDVKCSNRREED